MRVEALYRDGYKTDVLVSTDATLAQVVAIANQAHPVSRVKHVRIVPDVHDRKLDNKRG